MRRARGIFIGLTVVGLLASANASAGEPTRDEYVAAADQVCRDATKSARPHLERGEELLRREREDAGAKQFIAAFRIYRRYTDTLERLEPAPGDHQAVAKWLRGERRSIEVVIRSWVLFKREGLSDRVRDLGRDYRRIHRAAHQAVKGFGFKACT